MGWPQQRCDPKISLEEQAEAPCALPFFPGIDSWAVGEASSEGRAALCSTKATIRSGLVSRSVWGLQQGPGAVHAALGCLEGTATPAAHAAGQVVCRNAQIPVLQGHR